MMELFFLYRKSINLQRGIITNESLTQTIDTKFEIIRYILLFQYESVRINDGNAE